MSQIGMEAISNIRTVKSFADEEMCLLRFVKANHDVFDYGRAKGYVRCIFFLS